MAHNGPTFNLIVGDMDATVAFYRRLGLAIDAEPGAEHVEFTFPNGMVLEFDRTAFAAAGYRGRQRPYDAFWGARYAIVDDPDGNGIGLMSPVDDEHRSWPPGPAPGPPNDAHSF